MIRFGRTLVLMAGWVFSLSMAYAIDFPGPVPAKASAEVKYGCVALGNNVIIAEWPYNVKRLANCTVTDMLADIELKAECELFSIKIKDGGTYHSSKMKLVVKPYISDVQADPNAKNDLNKKPGKMIQAEFLSDDGLVRVDWTAEMRDGANFITQELGFRASTDGLVVDRITLFDQHVSGVKESGKVLGSPLVCGNIFFGYEHSVAVNEKSWAGRVHCYLDRGVPLVRGQRYEAVMIYGVAPAGQLRRGVMYYTELRRTNPGRVSLNYDSLYVIGCGKPYSSADTVSVIKAYGRELNEKRNVKLDSFMFGDGWCDTNNVWQFHADLKDGFGPAKAEAVKYKAGIGVCLDLRMAVSGPGYYEQLKTACFDLVRKYDVNQFKLDGVGSVGTGKSLCPGSRNGSDYDAMFKLIGDLRSERPDISINLAKGSWPSPFWLKNADTVSMGGLGCGFAGKEGSSRQQWITFRDSELYNGVVKKAPLYPLSAIMNHGIVYSKNVVGLDVSLNNDLKSEIRSYFATGSLLQQMHITPELMTEEDWDNLAESAKWARANSEVFKDVHWVGGNPLDKEVYGWAAWNKEKGVLTLRNPSRNRRTFALDVGKLFELPNYAAKQYLLISPYKDQVKTGINAEAGVTLTVELDPFEVLVFDAMPK